MSSQHSVSQWIAALKKGDSDAAQLLWDRYRESLLRLARRRLRSMSIGGADEEDVAQSVLLSIYRGFTSGRLDDIQHRNDLWWLLLCVTKQKSVDLLRRETAKKRGGGRVRTESALAFDQSDGEAFLDQLIGDVPSPEFVLILEEQSNRLMSSLADDPLRAIALLRIEGHSVSEIAGSLAVSTRSIERKLQMIRTAWTKELLHAQRRVS